MDDGKPKEEPDELLAEPSHTNSTWIFHMDGASNSLGSGAGLILTNSEGVVAKNTLCFLFKATNNQSEYEALLVGLKIIEELGVKYPRVFIDSF